MSSHDEEEQDLGAGTLKPVGYFRDRGFSETPCYRNSCLYGLVGGVGIGLGRFMLTSQLRQATMNGFYGTFAVLLPYYFYCRHKQATDRFKFQKIRKEVQRYLEEEGSKDVDPERIRQAAIEAGLPPSAFLKEADQ